MLGDLRINEMCCAFFLINTSWSLRLYRRPLWYGRRGEVLVWSVVEDGWRRFCVVEIV